MRIIRKEHLIRMSVKSFSSAIAILLALAPQAFAQSAAESDVEEDVVVATGQYLYSDQVKALKTPTPILDVPQSLSITTADQIITQGFDSLSDIVLYTPGVTQSQGEGHRDAIVFRGVRSTADFFIDGVRDDVQYYRSLYNLEQVEILRGPNALLFGRGGTGGILNRVTKRGQIGESFTGYKTSVDTFGAFDIQLDANFAVSENSAFRVNGFYEELNNHRDFFDGQRFGINPTGRLEFGASTMLDLSYEYIDNERFVDRGIPSDNSGAPADALADITFGDEDQNFTTVEAHVLRANLSHAFSDNLKGNFSASYSNFDKLYQNFFPVGFDDETNIVTLDGYVDTTQRQNFSLSANLIGEYETSFIGHTIVVGAEYIDTNNNNDRFNTFFSASQDDQETFLAAQPLDLFGGVGVNAAGIATTNSFSDLNDDTEADVMVLSAYIQDEIAISDHFDIVIGARFDSFDITVDNIETFINTGERETLSRTDEEISPRLGLIYKPKENISLYGSYSASFLPRSGEQFADINPPDDGLAPDTISNLEAGLKWDVARGLSLTAAVFEIEESSPQTADDDPGTLDVIDSDIQGFEAQIQGQITPDWFVSAGYSYLDGNQVNADGSTGYRVRELPKNTFNAWSNVQITDQFGLGAGVTYQDESFADNGNNTALPSFTRFDAAAFYDVNETLRLQVNVENLTDTEYFPNAHTADQISVGAPLNAKFTLSGQF